MLLRYSPTSPFVRKVEVAAAELGLGERLQRKPTNPWDPGDDLPADNPLGKVPALILDSGEVLYDSGVICEYLDGLHDREKLFPADGERRWRTLTTHALANGLLEATVLRFIERGRRPAELFWADWDTRQAQKVSRALDYLEETADGLEERMTIAHVAVGCALGYLDFRMPDEDWRGTHPRLAAWFETFAQRPSMQATMPAA